MPTRIRPLAIGAAMAAAPPTHGSPSLSAGNRARIAPDAMAITMAPLSPTSTARTTPSGLRYTTSPAPASRQARRAL